MKPNGELMAQWQTRAASDAWLQNLGRHCSMDLCIQVDVDPWFLGIEKGCLVSVDQGPFHMRRADLILSGPSSSWEKFFSPIPPAGFHDLFAMSSYAHVSVQGNVVLLREHLPFLKALLAVPRAIATNEAP